MANKHQVVIIGGGPGGYAAALYGASAGLDIAMIEKAKVGGTCLHVGCIPAKELLETAAVYRHVAGAKEFGINAGAPTVEWDVTLDRNLVPAAPRATNMAVSSPPTVTLPRGSVVDSYLIHGDALGASATAPGATLTGTFTFDEPILGVFMGRDNLVISDDLTGLTGTPGLTYEKTLVQRGLEFDSNDSVTVPSPNTIVVTFDFTAMDEIRVFTGQGPVETCTPDSSTNALVSRTEPGNSPIQQTKHVQIPLVISQERGEKVVHRWRAGEGGRKGLDFLYRLLRHLQLPQLLCPDDVEAFRSSGLPTGRHHGET